MRITGGAFSGRKLKTVMESGLRPAMGKTREALFSMLEARGIIWNEQKVLDLFAGCGSLGLECLSRGCERADFVEHGHKQYECIRENAASLEVEALCGFYRQDVARFLRRPSPKDYTLIFLDPPYGKNLVEKSLDLLANYGWLSKSPVIIAEIEKHIELRFPEILQNPQKRDFGQTSIHIWNL